MMMMNEVRAELFLRRLPQDVRATLTREQEQALRQAAGSGVGGNPHPVDIRISVPTPWGRYYLALFGGREKRSAARRASDRLLRPVASTANVLFVGGALAAACLLVLIGLLLVGAAVEV